MAYGDNLPHFSRVVDAHTKDNSSNVKIMIKYKERYSLNHMAKKTKNPEIIRFCELVDQMDRFEEPNY